MTSRKGEETHRGPVSVERVDRLIGNTPMVRLRRVGNASGAPIYIKLENLNPSGSIRDRYMAEILQRSVEAGMMMGGDRIALVAVDDSAVAAALLGGLLGLRLHVFAPQGSSQRLVRMLTRFGAEITWTEEAFGIPGAVEAAVAWTRGGPDRFYIDAFRREAVCEAYSAVAEEVLRALDGQAIGAFVTSVSTGGTFREVSPYLRRSHPSLKMGGAVLVDREVEHLVQHPQDVLRRVTLEEAWEMRDLVAEREGLLLGAKGAACVLLALELQVSMSPDEAIVALNPDAGARYLGWEDKPLF